MKSLARLLENEIHLQTDLNIRVTDVEIRHAHIAVILRQLAATRSEIERLTEREPRS